MKTPHRRFFYFILHKIQLFRLHSNYLRCGVVVPLVLACIVRFPGASLLSFDTRKAKKADDSRDFVSGKRIEAQRGLKMDSRDDYINTDSPRFLLLS